MLLGAGLTQIVLERNKKSICYSAYIYSVCFMLTMAKFSGILFSVMLIVAYVWEFFGIKIKCKDIRRIGFLFFVFAGLPGIPHCKMTGMSQRIARVKSHIVEW